MSPMKLYGVPPTRAIRPIWVLNELELECEIVSIFPFDQYLDAKRKSETLA